jgi:hypothetical protein
MDEVIWVEVLSRHRDVVARYRCAGPVVTIGRAYDNDVVVDDPYVAPRHIRIVRDPAGRLVAEHLGSTNGLYAGHGRERQERIVLDGIHPIRIGHTLLQVRDAYYKVAPERVAHAPGRSWPVLVALGVAIIGLEVLSSWQHDTGEFKFSRYLGPLEFLAVVLGAWVTAWAILTRIFSGHAHFERTLLIALSGLLAFSLYNEISGDLAFALSWPLPQRYQYVIMWATLAVACFFHLREIGRAHPWIKGGVVAAAMLLAIAVQTLGQSELRAGADPNVVATTLLPPSFRLRPLQSEDSFFAEVEQLKSKLDKARGDDSE